MQSELMKKSSLSWTLLLMVAVAVILSVPLYGLEAAEDTLAVPQAGSPVVNPAEPKKDAGPEAELPLFLQETNSVLESRFLRCCTSDAWCEERFGPGSTCETQGDPCGHCT